MRLPSDSDGMIEKVRLLILLIFAISAWAQSEISSLKIFQSDAVPVTGPRAQDVLKAICPAPIAIDKSNGREIAKCFKICPAGTDFAGNPEDMDAAAVTFGHFLSPESDDALVSMEGCASHASGFGGSYLLTKNAGAWNVFWYRQSILTEHCHIVTRRDRRQELVCENSDTHQGVADRLLYLEDLTAPDTPGANRLFGVLDTTCAPGSDPPTIHSFISRVEFTPAGMTVYANFGELTLTPDQIKKSRQLGETVFKDACVHVDIPTKLYEIEFLFDGVTYHVVPASRSAAEIFQR